MASEKITKKSTKSKATKKAAKAAAATRRATPPKNSRAARSAVKRVCEHCGAPLRPTYIPGETPEEREKRLAARKALTLKAFQSAYENHQRRRKAP